MSERTFFSLSTITGRIQEILQPYIGKLFWVKAEISSGRERGGSFYCDLVETKDSGEIIAQMRCTIWSRDLSNIRKKFKDSDLDLILDDGTAVGFQCSIQYSPRYGLSLKVNDADPAFALGELELKKKEILDRLKKEGLLEPNKKLYVPILPINIGLITSKGSAAYNDFINTLEQSNFGFRVYLADSMVQGNKAEQSILHALETLEILDLELVLILRGGGSKTELFSLDNEQIARKIATCKYPVWTGIGHEIDTSILDHVANRYFKTPTAVAEELVARFIEMKRHLEEAEHRFKSSWTYRLDVETKFIQSTKAGLVNGTRKLIENKNANLKQRANLLSSMVFDRLSKEKSTRCHGMQQWPSSQSQIEYSDAPLTPEPYYMVLCSVPHVNPYTRYIRTPVSEATGYQTIRDSIQYAAQAPFSARRTWSGKTKARGGSGRVLHRRTGRRQIRSRKGRKVSSSSCRRGSTLDGQQWTQAWTSCYTIRYRRSS